MMVIEKEMQSPVGGALTGLEWFLLFSFVDFAMKKDEMFSSEEDRENLAFVVKRLHDQIFPPKKSNIEELEQSLAIKPKKILTAPDLIV